MKSPSRLGRAVQSGPPVAEGLRPAFLAEHVTQSRYFFTDRAERGRTKLTLPCGGSERCSANYVVRRKSFRYFALEYVVEGRGQFTCNGHMTKLQPGILFGYAPGNAHVISSDAAQSLVKFFLDFSGPRAKNIFQRLPLNKGGTTWIRQPQVIRDLFQQIVEAGQQPSYLSRRLCTSLFDVLLLRIEQNAMRTEEATCRAFETYNRASYELSAEFRELRSSADLAQRLQITPAYLARLFQRYSDTSPHQALTAMKMAEAASLLVGTDATVANAAAHVGFADPYHFSRVFKNYYGTAPAHFRLHPRSTISDKRRAD
ncbi:AraC family transcriptional regulator [Granulicella sp. L46]|uniref:helix-turn-helix domain-containing protein n=1 Tax=Granulicella sp. L46 TaxID=1641865 RepID=UPI0020B12DE4|nr:AraC family transcriptional regulator [Granulicella sp. L46]